MIIQKVIKGLFFNVSNGPIDDQIKYIFENGLICNLWRNNPNMPYSDMLRRLTPDDLDWHQNRFTDPYPGPYDPPFWKSTPFISTTAGTVLPSTLFKNNVLFSAIVTALRFATDRWTHDHAWLVYAYVFVLGKQSVKFVQFSEELRELNVYSGWSAFQPEGEVTAKLIIPAPQIERIEMWSRDPSGRYTPVYPFSPNPNYVIPETISNIRDYKA